MHKRRDLAHGLAYGAVVIGPTPAARKKTKKTKKTKTNDMDQEPGHSGHDGEGLGLAREP
jgi:hypothetical protein